MRYIYYIIAYLIGSVSFSYLFVKIKTGEDIRKSGSKNAGGTNVLRTYGLKLGLLSALFDLLKGTLVVYLFKRFNLGYPLLALFFAVLGHCFPIFLGFKGGKGIATTAGGLILLYFKFLPFGLVIFLGLAYLTKYVSVASIFMVFATGALILYTQDLAIYETIAIIGIMFTVIFMHRGNIKRLIHGEERKLHIGGKK